VRIENIKYVGEEETYDIINVTPNNNYIANGMVVHNSVDEANFLEVIEDSKRAGFIDTYDAAEEMYNAIWTRMNSRFMRAGKVPGMIVMISSPRYPDDFLEKKIKEAIDQGKGSKIFWKRLRLWETKPNIWQGETIWTGDKFIFDIDELRVIPEGEEIPKNSNGEENNTLDIPIELIDRFQNDPERALRDLAGHSMMALSPYFRDKGKINEALKKDLKNPFDQKTLKFNPEFKCNDDFARYIHIDLAAKKDAVGISMCHVPYFTNIDKTSIISGDVVKETVRVPFVQVDFVGRVSSKQGEEILFSDIQDIIFTLQDLGFFINLISFDQFQSTMISQILRDSGFTVGQLSIDRTSFKLLVDHEIKSDKGQREGTRRESTGRQYTAAMQSLKDAMYEKRIAIPYHKHLLKEMLRLELIRRNNIELVSKPIRGTDDVVQSLAGSVFNACNNEIEFIDVDERSHKSEPTDEEDTFYDDLDKDVRTSDKYGDGGDPFYDEDYY
jgi:hypothetical protein